MTIWDEMAESLHRSRFSDSDGARALRWTRDARESGAFDSFLDVLVQQDPRRPWGVETDAVLACMVSAIEAGAVEIEEWPLGESPWADREWRRNAECLSRLGPHLTVTVYPASSGNDEDGVLHARCEDGTAATFPVEIGTTSAARTFAHLIQERALLRWPYGHPSLYFIRSTPTFRSQYAAAL